MNEINDFVVGPEATMPRMGGVRAVDANTILVNWIEGARSGRTEAINLSPLLDSYKAYTPLRRNKPLFATVHIIDNGNAIAWGDDNAIDMPATSIERLAEEAMTSDDFYEFMKRNHLTHDAAASVLGRSRRMIEYYLTTGAIPRLLALACFGYEARRTKERERHFR